MRRLKPSSKKLPELVNSVTKIAKKPVRVFFQDEACFGRICQVRKVWLPKDERSEVKAQHIQQYTYVYSAIEPKTGESVSLILQIMMRDATRISPTKGELTDYCRGHIPPWCPIGDANPNTLFNN